MPIIYYSLAVITGMLPLLWLQHLPSNRIIMVCASIALATLCFRRLSLRLRLLCVTVLALSWAVVTAKQQLAMVDTVTGSAQQFRVKITAVEPSKQRIQLKLLQRDQQWLHPALKGWAYTNQVYQYCTGQYWDMKLRIRPVHARLNQGGYDAQRYALASYSPIQAKILQQRVRHGECDLRHKIILQQHRTLKAFTWGGVVEGFVFGRRDAVPNQINSLFRETGIAHIMAISGMHISMVAFAGWGLSRLIQFILPIRLISPLMAVMVGWGLALFYTWLSGAQPSAVRAMLGLTLWIVIKRGAFNLTSEQTLILCFSLLLIFDPMMMLSDSLWLSVLAIMMLLSWYRWFPLGPSYRTHWYWGGVRLVHLQIGMCLLMLPIQALLFKGISLTALPANFIAIPITSFITLPLAMLALIASAFDQAEGIWWLTERSIAVVIWMIHRQSAWLTLVDGLGCAIVCWGGILLVRSGWWQRYPCSSIAGLFCLALWRFSPERPLWRVDMLDTGQALAVVVSQGSEAILYDTGNQWPGGDSAASTIIPWLRQQGIILVQIILSHSHRDHRGGLATLRQTWPTIPLRNNYQLQPTLACHRGIGWQWKRLNFEVLWPEKEKTRGDNDDSCVIKISDGKVSLLLTGDIELAAEQQMVALNKSALKATFIQVPHHGSNSSSGALLLRTVNGEVALASVARFNAWHMPSIKVINRYHNAGYQWLDTARGGQLTLLIDAHSYRVITLREHISPAWYHRAFGFNQKSS